MEGEVNRLKVINRQIYASAELVLLRAFTAPAIAPARVIGNLQDQGKTAPFTNSAKTAFLMTITTSPCSGTTPPGF
jgi:hypothetical protein